MRNINVNPGSIVYSKNLSVEKKDGVGSLLEERVKAFTHWFFTSYDRSSSALINIQQPSSLGLRIPEAFSLRRNSMLDFVEEPKPNYPNPQVVIYPDTMGYRIVNIDKTVPQTLGSSSDSRRRARKGPVETNPGILQLLTPLDELKRIHTIMTAITEHERGSGRISESSVVYWDISKKKPIEKLDPNKMSNIGVAVVFGEEPAIELSKIDPNPVDSGLMVYGFVLKPELGSKSNPSESSHGKILTLAISKAI